MNYEDMSDFDINSAVAKHFYRHRADPEHYKFYRLSDGSGDAVQVNAYKMWPKNLDYCNNPSDIMPIAIDNGIQLTLDGHYEGCLWFAKPWLVDVHADDENPYRAIAICFLKMKDAEQ